MVSPLEGQFDGQSEQESTRLTKRCITPFNGVSADLSPEFSEWLAARHDFMVQRGWRRDDMTEWDAYDANPHTGHIVIQRNNELVYGMRLTPVVSTSQSLSWRMVEQSAMQATIDPERVDVLGDSVWDLTRLVPGKGAQLHDGAAIIPLLFQEGFKYCQQVGSDDPTWVFALDGPMHTWLTKHGVAIEVLGRDKVGADKNETLFGLVRPSEVDDSSSASTFVQRYWSAA